MTQYNSVNVKIITSQLEKKCTGITLMLSIKVIGNETSDFLHTL